MRLFFLVFVLISFLDAKNVTGLEIVNEANKYIGKPYVWGGNNLQKGIDCSAFIKEIYKKYNYKLPRTASWQVKDTKECPTYRNINDIELGDTLYFKKNGKIHHTAFVTGLSYTKDKTYIVITHAKGKMFGVVREEMSNYYKKQLIAIKKFYKCTSPLKNEITNIEIADSIHYIKEKYSISEKTLFSLISIESDFKPLVITIETNPRVAKILAALRDIGVKIKTGGTTFHSKQAIVDIYPANIEMAVFIAKNLKRLGYIFDVGLAQINSTNLTIKEIDKIFYPKVNLEKAAQILKSCARQYNSLKLQLECYNRGAGNIKRALRNGDNYYPYWARYKQHYKNYFKGSK
jgi:hypothetical protein